MHKLKITALAITLSSFSGIASAALLDFNDSTDLGVTLGGSMNWSGTGGGHLYSDNTLDNDFIFLLGDTYVNSFEMNAMAWDGFNKGNPGPMNISGFNASNDEIWTTTIDLTDYTSWDNWLTVSVETANIAKLTFFATGNAGFWPSIDNMVINEVPVPTAFWLFGSGLLGLIGLSPPYRYRK
jgi:hypothetical protein